MQAVTVVLACFGGLVLLLALSRWLAGRRWASLGHAVLAAVLLLAAAWLRPIAAHLATYQPRQAQGPVAQVSCERTSSRSYRLTLTRLPSGQMQVFEVAGDQWHIDARTLAWRGRAVDLGLRPGLRLERLSTRFVRTAAPQEAAPSSYRLSEEHGDDLWTKARAGGGWSAHIIAEPADGPWLPLAEDARYEISVDADRLVAQPANEAAAQATAGTSTDGSRATAATFR